MKFADTQIVDLLTQILQAGTLLRDSNNDATLTANALLFYAHDITLGDPNLASENAADSDIWYNCKHIYFGAPIYRTVGGIRATFPAPLGNTLGFFARTDGTAADVQMMSWTAASTLSLERVKGTPDAYTPVQLNDTIGTFAFRGYASGGAPSTVAQLRATAADTFDSTHKGVSLAWSTVKAGASESIATRFTIDQFGYSGGPSLPVVVRITGVTVLTVGTGDIGYIDLPPWLTRWMMSSSANMSTVIAETGGNMSGGSITLYTAASQGGTAITAAITLPAALTGANSRTNIAGQVANTSQSWFTASRIYIYQGANSSNAGTISIYLTLWPLIP